MANEVFGEIIEIAFEFIPRYVGAFLKWIYLKFKVSFSEVLEQKGNTSIGYVSLGILILVTLIIINFLK
ncbi:MAG: hypothetical protein ABIQ27_05540 [Flavobacterium sp.]|uniref:hypothetical protein n=1 Tax=Flavobacterium sp. TaxID=239 RepID=UPI0032639394